MHVSKYEIIIKIAETHSFSRTAEYYQYTQSAISQIVRSIESELKVKLFQRTKKGVLLTEEGKKLLPDFISIFNAQRSLDNHINELHQLQSGIVRFGTYLSLSTHWIPKCIRGFKKSYPNITFEFYQDDDLALIEMVRHSMIDFAIISDPKVREIEYRGLFNDPFVAVLPVNHSCSAQSHVTLEDLGKSPLITLDVGYSKYMNDIFRQAGIRPNICYRMIDDVSIMTMVEQEHGVSILPKYVTTRQPFRIKIVPFYPLFFRQLGFIQKEKSMISQASRKFIDYLDQHLPEGYVHI